MWRLTMPGTAHARVWHGYACACMCGAHAPTVSTPIHVLAAPHTLYDSESVSNKLSESYRVWGAASKWIGVVIAGVRMLAHASEVHACCACACTPWHSLCSGTPHDHLGATEW